MFIFINLVALLVALLSNIEQSANPGYIVAALVIISSIVGRNGKSNMAGVILQVLAIIVIMLRYLFF
jgi:hypothetical protein